MKPSEYEVRCPKCNRLLMKVRLGAGVDLEIETRCSRSGCGVTVVWPRLVAAESEAQPARVEDRLGK